MRNLALTLALEHYDRHVPLFDGSVAVEGVELTALHVGQNVPGPHGQQRHQRILAGEFDGGELSLANYLMARDRGAALTAIPVFPRRLFSQSRAYVHVAAGIDTPADLAGKRVGLNTFQTTLSVLFRGDLQAEYEVPWRAATWVVAADEAVPFEPAPGVRIERVPAGTTLEAMLLEGQIEAVAMPHPPPRVQGGDPRVRRLFADAQGEEQRYYARHGYWPIMHVVAFKTAVLEAHPWVARACFDAFEAATRVAYERYEDPNWSLLAWGRQYLEAEQRELAPGPWRNGLAANRDNLVRFIEYAHEQGLIARGAAPEERFVEGL